MPKIIRILFLLESISIFINITYKVIKHSIVILSILFFQSCKTEKPKIKIFKPIYQLKSNLIKCNYPSGIYSNDTLLLKIYCDSIYSLKLIYKGDTLKRKNQINFGLKSSNLELMNIPTTTKIYDNYENHWVRPKGDFSSFHQIKLLISKNNIIIDSSILNYIIGAHSEMNVPIVQIQVDREYLFSSDSGCYIPGKTIDIEKKETSGNFYTFKKRKQQGHFEMWKDDSLYLNGNYNFRIHGYITPLSPQKSLLLYLTKANSVNKILNVSHQVDKIILRSSFAGWGYEIFTDGFISEICKNLNVDVMAYHPVITYLNGEYWGIHGLRERMDLEAISKKYNIEKKKLIDADDKGFSKKRGYGDLNKLLLSIKENPNIDYNIIKKEFHMKSLIDWLIIELFFQNNDWPCNNTFFWKKKKGKWNCVLIDMDASIGTPKFNMFNFIVKDRSPALGGVLYSYLLHQNEFRTNFTNRANYLLNHDLSASNLTINFLKFKTDFDPIVREHYQRWNHIDGLKKYNKSLERIELFCKKRGIYFKRNMNDFFKSN